MSLKTTCVRAIPQAEIMHSKGITLFAVAMSGGTQMDPKKVLQMNTELKAIATDPDSKHLINSTFDELVLNIDTVQQFICDNSEYILFHLRQQ